MRVSSSSTNHTVDRRRFLRTLIHTGAGVAGASVLYGLPEKKDAFLLSSNGCGRATGYAEANPPGPHCCRASRGRPGTTVFGDDRVSS